MGRSKGSFRLAKPICPQCDCDEVRLVCSAGNWARIAADVVTALFLWPVFAYQWKCQKCGHEFSTEQVTER
jgi:hypothetical protein